jgi:hypothetical protein
MRLTVDASGPASNSAGTRNGVEMTIQASMSIEHTTVQQSVCLFV